VFDASLAVLTTHHWTDGPGGLAEMARVSRRQVVLTWDQARVTDFWLVRDYLPEIAEGEAQVCALATVTAAWPDSVVSAVPVPWDCTDGFLAAYWRRPDDLGSGEWARRNGDLLEREELDCSYRLVVRTDG
jgi:hypothetical protein